MKNLENPLPLDESDRNLLELARGLGNVHMATENQDQIIRLVKLGLLKRVDDQRYSLTETGRAALSIVMANTPNQKASPTEKLAPLLQQIRQTMGNATELDRQAMIVTATCAAEIGDQMRDLSLAVSELNRNSATVLNNAIKEMKSAGEASDKATSASLRLGTKLNTLTYWLVGTAILSALAACIQAYVAWQTLK